MKCAVVIPIYNHGRFVTPLVEAVVGEGLRCILVDDGSLKETVDILERLAGQFSEVAVIRHEKNRGKGAAVISGVTFAAKKGFTSVLQIDADGQHDIEDLPRFIAASNEGSNLLVLGKPVFDESIPRHRFYCRYLTHALVWLECLSFEIADSMCGYRVYPVISFLELSGKGKLPPRMDFDTEVAVRLYWQGVRIITLETQVRYPENGLSNFRMIKDNLRMTSMHIRLLGGMILRFPRLLARNFRRKM